jgi:hypothetical protein
MQADTNSAILRKLNDLVARYGLELTDFAATIHPDVETGQYTLCIETLTGGLWLCESSFEQMLIMIGADLATGTLKGTATEIIDSLDAALRLAPCSHLR